MSALKDDQAQARKGLPDVPKSAIGDGPMPRLTWMRAESAGTVAHCWDAELTIGKARVPLSIMGFPPISAFDEWRFLGRIGGIFTRQHDVEGKTLREKQLALEKTLLADLLAAQLSLLGYVPGPDLPTEEKHAA